MKLTEAALLANIDHYESLVAKSKDDWEQHLQQLQYWMDELEKARENTLITHSN